MLPSSKPALIFYSPFRKTLQRTICVLLSVSSIFAFFLEPTSTSLVSLLLRQSVPCQMRSGLQIVEPAISAPVHLSATQVRFDTPPCKHFCNRRLPMSPAAPAQSLPLWPHVLPLNFGERGGSIPRPLSFPPFLFSACTASLRKASEPPDCQWRLHAGHRRRDSPGPGPSPEPRIMSLTALPTSPWMSSKGPRT